MVTFRIDDMTCGHCASVVGSAVKLVDPRALVEVELAARLVHVASANGDDDEIEKSIREVGYTPVRQ